ncbi:MAG TPA: hypothetical protein VND19_09375 [Acetobacteraceae bacterium]|nr:hypothetical protein [Acetobacteraceae bacterium]
MRIATVPCREPRTAAVRRALERVRCDAAIADLLFLEAWEASPTPEVATVLRVAQIRRANPELAQAVRGELAERKRSR